MIIVSNDINDVADELWDRIATVYPVPAGCSRYRFPVRDEGDIVVNDLQPGVPRRLVVDGRPVTIVRQRDMRRV